MRICGTGCFAFIGCRKPTRRPQTLLGHLGLFVGLHPAGQPQQPPETWTRPRSTDRARMLVNLWLEEPGPVPGRPAANQQEATAGQVVGGLERQLHPKDPVSQRASVTGSCAQIPMTPAARRAAVQRPPARRLIPTPPASVCAPGERPSSGSLRTTSPSARRFRVFPWSIGGKLRPGMTSKLKPDEGFWYVETKGRIGRQRLSLPDRLPVGPSAPGRRQVLSGHDPRNRHQSTRSHRHPQSGSPPQTTPARNPGPPAWTGTSKSPTWKWPPPATPNELRFAGPGLA